MSLTDIPIRSLKVGRNDPCPCGSGKKYKKCHDGIEEIPTPPPGKVDAQLKKLAPAQKCLVPESMSSSCSKGIIQAHTVSRSASLGAIARDGHVYSYKMTVQHLFKSEGEILPTLVGWRDASTFPGFCGHHDKSLFAPLEDAPFIGSKQQCFLLAYRIIAREYYAKLGSSMMSDYRDAISNENADLSGFTGALNLGVELGLRDSKRHKQRYDKVLETSDWRSVKAIIFELKGIFPIQCAGGFFPDEDINGNVIQTYGIGKKTPEAITVSSFSANGRSYISFCWLLDSDRSCNAFVSALEKLPVDQLPAVLGALLIEKSENCHFAPDWYDELPEVGKKWASSQARIGMPNIEMTRYDSKSAITFKDLSYFKDVQIESILRL